MSTTLQISTQLSSSTLPTSLTPLIGRDSERRALCTLLRRSAVQLVTLTGPGGTGKTRLSQQIAADLLDDFTNGVYFVQLAPVREPALVLTAIAQTLGVVESSGQSLLETLQSFLAKKRVLLVLDNFEQVELAAPFVSALLAEALNVKALVTSRIILHLTEEYEFAVPPLALPVLGHLPPLNELAHNEAVALFVQRAQAIRSDFQLSTANAAAIAEICCKLDGLPLAIELAAARCRLLSAQALLAHWTNALHLLTGGSRNLPSRQQTLRATIDWSYHLLDPDEQTLFRRLAIFVGGCTLEAAAAVCAMDDPPVAVATSSGERPAYDVFAVLDRLTALADQSLLRQIEQADGEPRFFMLETIREYAQECLASSGELPLLRQLHVDHFLALAEEAEPKLTTGEQLTWLTRLELEHDNMRAALHECKHLAGGVELALRIAAALWRFWDVRGHVSEGRTWLEGLLAQAALEPFSQSMIRVRATALYRAASVVNAQNDYQRAITLAEESLALFRMVNDMCGIAWSHYTLGLTALLQGDYAHAATHFTEGLPLFRALADARGIGWTLNEMGSLAMMQGDYSQAAIYHNESLAVARQLGSTYDIVVHLIKRAMLAQAEGNYGHTVADLRESLVLCQQLDYRTLTPLVIHSLAYVAQIQGDYEQAQALFSEALHLYEKNSRSGVARCLIGLAMIAETTGELLHATHLFGAAATQYDNVKPFLEPEERRSYDQSLATVRTQLGDKQFNAAWVEGRAMTLTQVLEPPKPTQQRLSPPPPTAPSLHLPTTPPVAILAAPPSSINLPTGLSEREAEVLKLLARGLSYTDIADQLVISPRTVNRHLTSIYTKLNVTSRHAATRFALDHGLA